MAGVPGFETGSGVSGFPVQHLETALTPPPGARPRHRLGKWDKCDWSGSQVEMLCVKAQTVTCVYVKRA